jgi:hypothetical protein
VRPHLTFIRFYNTESYGYVNVISQIDIGGGYANGPLDIGLTVGIPTVEYGMKYQGLSIAPRITFAIKPNIKTYLDVLLSGVGSYNNGGVSPTIGGFFSL